MSCYFRYMKDVFQELGITVTEANKKAVDQAVHKLVAVQYKDCSPTWKEVKARIKGDPKQRAAFVKALKKALKA